MNYKIKRTVYWTKYGANVSEVKIVEEGRVRNTAEKSMFSFR